MNSVIKFIKRRIIKPIESTYLCFKYPFLYPRNRFTGLHYNNWKIHDYHVKNYNNAIKYCYIHIYKKEEWDKIESKKLYTFFDGYNCDKSNNIFNIKFKNKILHKIDIDELCLDYCGHVLDFGFYNSYNGSIDFAIILHDFEKIKNERFFIVKRICDKWLYFKIKFLDFLNDYILQLFHCIPLYTEIDCMKSECPGWYKRFGMDLVKDLKKQLKIDNRLYSFRIMQIKEKYGRLEFYHNGCCSSEIYKIIEKYQDLSVNTCIECGEEAKITTDGYICPYCTDCYNKYHKNEMIGYKKDENGDWVEI